MKRTVNEADLRAGGPGGAIMKKALRLRIRILSAFIGLSAVRRGISKVMDDPGDQSRGCLAAPSWGGACLPLAAFACLGKPAPCSGGRGRA